MGAAFVVRMKKLCINGWLSKMRPVNAQADLNLGWVHMYEGRFSDVAAHKIPLKTNTHSEFKKNQI